MTKITHIGQKELLLRKSGLVAMLMPNGELVVSRKKLFQKSEFCDRIPSSGENEGTHLASEPTQSEDGSEPKVLGLVNVRNFDKRSAEKSRIGLKGLTSKGKRSVRNAAFLIENDVRKELLTFATVTVPPMERELMAVIHREWHRVVDAYRREITRELKRHNLPGELVGVSEIQPKRFETHGEPVLHCHFVWIGAKHRYKWAIKPAKHDEIWKRALAVALPGVEIDITKACRMDSVTGSVESYLGKYISKGPEDIEAVLQAGYIDWLPKQWWSLTRSLKRRIDRETRYFSSGIQWLLGTQEDSNGYLWRYHKDVYLEREDMPPLWVANVGRLTKRANSMVRAVLEDVLLVNKPGFVKGI